LHLYKKEVNSLGTSLKDFSNQLQTKDFEVKHLEEKNITLVNKCDSLHKE
jgi:hypothetical protein